jgi:hypothetical protein
MSQSQYVETAGVRAQLLLELLQQLRSSLQNNAEQDMEEDDDAPTNQITAAA